MNIIHMACVAVQSGGPFAIACSLIRSSFVEQGVVEKVQYNTVKDDTDQESRSLE